MAREAGYRSKVAVSSIDMKVDCVGACVGVRGSRIKNVIDEINGELDGTGRVFVRPSGTEPVVRVLVEAENELEARRLCGTISTLVSRELG